MIFNIFECVIWVKCILRKNLPNYPNSSIFDKHQIKKNFEKIMQSFALFEKNVLYLPRKKFKK